MPANKHRTQELLNLIGDEAFGRLCKAFGGDYLHITCKSARLQHRLDVLVGENIAEKIISAFESSDVYLPRVEEFVIKKRNRNITEYAKRGMREGEIALVYGLTESEVRGIVSDPSHYRNLKRNTKLSHIFTTAKGNT